jgi:type IV pilus assembly protein PilV
MKTSKQPFTSMRRKQHGFSLIEILVTFLIVTLALFGTAGLQAYSMRFNQSGQFRGQAVSLAGDMAERIEANLQGGRQGLYNIPLSSAAPATNNTSDCSAINCTSTTLAGYDVYQWQTAVAAVLPQSSWSVSTSVNGTTLIASTVTVAWLERPANTSNSTATATQAVTATYVTTRLTKL